MTFIQMRCPYCDGKNVEEQNTYTIKCGAPRTMYHCSSCERAFSETRNTPIAQLKTPIAIVVQVLAALTEGLGINAATRLYGVSKNSIYRWQERLSGLKKQRTGKRLRSIQVPAFQCCEQERSFFFERALRMILRRWIAST